MIKTEIESDEADVIPELVEADQTPVNVPSRQLAIGAIVIVLVIAAATFLVYAKNNSSPSMPAARDLGNVSALPLIAGSASSNQNGPNATSLSASDINLQNNLPSGQGSPKTNSLQSTGNSLSTGQSINSAVPF